MQIFKLSTLTLALSCCLATACGPEIVSDGIGGECTMSCLPGEEAVICQLNALNKQIQCAPTIALASAACSDAGGVAGSPVAACPEGHGSGGDEAGEDGAGGDEAGENEAEGGSEIPTWNPSDYVSVDAASGDLVLDLDMVEELERDPTLLVQDSTHLGRTSDGFFRVTRVGLLAEALGWELGDVLLDLNGHGIKSMDDFFNTREKLGDVDEFQLNGLRNGEPVVVSYRIK